MNQPMARLDFSSSTNYEGFVCVCVGGGVQYKIYVISSIIFNEYIKVALNQPKNVLLLKNKYDIKQMSYNDIFFMFVKSKN